MQWSMAGRRGVGVLLVAALVLVAAPRVESWAVPTQPELEAAEDRAAELARLVTEAERALGEVESRLAELARDLADAEADLTEAVAAHDAAQQAATEASDRARVAERGLVLASAELAETVVLLDEIARDTYKYGRPAASTAMAMFETVSKSDDTTALADRIHYLQRGVGVRAEAVDRATVLKVEVEHLTNRARAEEEEHQRQLAIADAARDDAAALHAQVAALTDETSYQLERSMQLVAALESEQLDVEARIVNLEAQVAAELEERARREREAREAAERAERERQEREAAERAAVATAAPSTPTPLVAAAAAPTPSAPAPSAPAAPAPSAAAPSAPAAAAAAPASSAPTVDAGAAERDRQARAERDRQAQAERDRQAQAERDRQAQAERDRQAQAQAEREGEAQAQAERDRQARAQAERDRQAQAQAERDRQAQAERDRQAQAERDRQAQAERDRQERQRQEREAAERAERERQEREAAERAAQAERDRRAQEERQRQEREAAQRAAASTPIQAGPNPSLRTVGGITVAASLAPNLQALLDHARRDGIVLGGSGYRSPEITARLRLANGCPDVYTSPPSACRVPTAIPGTSEHEKGLAVDFTYQGQTICFPLRSSSCTGNRAFDWLRRNASSYGLYNLPSEAWHWSTTGR
jgi:septal ring factor EnvC (AmiA/AmiB activator)